MSDQSYNEKCHTPGGHVFQPTGTIFPLNQDIIGTNLLTYHKAILRQLHRPLVALLFQATESIFEHIQDIIGNFFLTKGHEDRAINVASRRTTDDAQRIMHAGRRTKGNHKSSP
ncbi:hypothetical protein DPMN_151347 [Dreissena polymorpha]|uniref:Uncharacterized protein n=1 Tax=Dreissena polymorpha TaxID=45954 RepID=A0A9D4FGZ1_DREPO|nr:hypothetical protein DPMN_151347 [Dreissena polymorpha]